MEKLTKDQAKQAIEKYYAEHLACGVKIDVKDITITEREGGGRTVNATVIFLEKTTGDPEPMKLAIPENDGVLDWTTTTIDAGGPHESEPVQDSSPSQELGLPKNNQKPKDGGTFEGPEGEYVQKPEKVGSEIPKKAKKAKEAAAFDNDGWPNPDQLLEGDTETSSDPDDWLVQSDRGELPDVDVEMHEAATLTESSAVTTSVFPVGEDTEEVMKVENENLGIALLEYVSTVEVADLGKRLHGLKLTFADSLTQDMAIRILEKLDEVVEVERGEGTEVGVVVQQVTEDDDPSAVLREMVGDLASVNIGWEEGHEEKYNEALSDNSGFYHKGVQTTANEPAAANPSAGADTVGGEEGGDTKSHAGISKQGGAGVGKTKPASQKKLKLKGSKGESLTEQGFLDDIVSFDDEGGEDPEADLDLEPEIGADQAMPEAGDLDPVIAELVRAQAENGLDTVMQVAQAHAEENGIEWDEAMEQSVRDAYATAVGDQEPEAEVDVDVDVEPEDDEMGLDVGVDEQPFESVQEADTDEDEKEEKAKPDDDAEEKEKKDEPEADADEEEEKKEPESEKDEPEGEVDPSAETDVIPTDTESEETEDEDEIDEKKPPLGSGERFKKLKKEIGAKGDVSDPGAVAAAIGRKKHGKEKFQKMAAKGRKAASQEVDPEQVLTASEANDQYELGLTGDQVKALGKALFKAVALEAAMKDESKKAGIIEQLKIKADALGESAENPNTIGGKETYKRVKGKNKAASPFGWVKPNVKFMGQIRVVWDDGHESWEKPGDVQAVSNPRGNKAPSGGATKPGSQKTDKEGGEELDMIKNLEALKKQPDRAKRFRKVVELAVKSSPGKLPDKAVEVLIEGWDEFEHDELSSGLTSLFESKKEAKLEADPEPEDKESDDNESIQVISEDFGEDGEQITTIDLE